MFISIELQFDYKFKYNEAKTHNGGGPLREILTFLTGNFGQKNLPYGFFAPMSNLTKVPFWTN